MTSDEAIKEIECMKKEFINLHTSYQMKKKESKNVIGAYGMAIKALKQEPCRDAISRQGE